MQEIKTVLALLVAVVALTLAAERLQIAYPIVLVVGGLAIGFIPGLPRVALEPSVVFLLFLPPILFYEGLTSSIRDLRANVRPITLLAVELVLASIAAVAYVAKTLVPGLPWSAAVLLGAIVGPTDETAAIVIAERLQIPKRLIIVIKAESLFNDAVSLVIYAVTLSAITSGRFSLPMASLQLVLSAVGGLLIGLFVGWGVGFVRRRIHNPPVENVMSLLTGFAAYLPADALHCSGVIAAITTGLYMGRHGPNFVAADTRLQNVQVRRVVLYLINGLLFVLVGLQLHGIVNSLSGFSWPHLIHDAVAIVCTVIAVRIAGVFAAVHVPRALSPSLRIRDPAPSWQQSSLVSWVGMRGGVSLAAALAIPFTIEGGRGFPDRAIIVFLTFSVTFSTLVLQGLTLPALIGRLRIAPDASENAEERSARERMLHDALARLEDLSHEPWADADVIAHIKKRYEVKLAHVGHDHGDESALDDMDVVLRVERELIATQRRTMIALRDSDDINDETMGVIQNQLDLEDVRQQR